MTRQAVVSTSIVGVGYAAAGRILEVEFVGGAVYEYLEVPAAEHAALMSATSKGQHINGFIKVRYHFRRVAA